MKDESLGEWVENLGSQGIWLPDKAGEKAEGVVEEVKQGDYGVQVNIKNDEGEIITTPSHKVLQNRLTGIKVGDNIRIEYVGEELPKVKGQKPTRIYKVFVKRIGEEQVN